MAALAGLAALGLQGVSPLDVNAEHATPPDHRIVYGSDPLEFAELRLPPGPGPFPVAVVIHGGCWYSVLDGLPPDVVTLSLTRPLATALTAAGFATLNVEYRRIGDPGGGWPGTFDDIASATDKLRSLAKPYHLDLRRTIAVGHSAGGQLAEWLGARGELSRKSDLYRKHPLPLAGVVDLDGPPGLNLADDVTTTFCGTDTIGKLVGGTPAQVPQRYHDGSAEAMRPSKTPQQIFVSHSFGPLWPSVFHTYDAEVRVTHDPVTTHYVTAANHFDLIDPQGTFWPQIVNAARALIGQPPVP